jgi:hypothetical protein
VSTRYDAGRRFEWAVRDDLRADGYDVIRSAGSKSKVDLVAIKRHQILLVQCKRNGLISPAERTQLYDIFRHVPVVLRPIVAYKAKTGIGYRVLTGTGPKDWLPWTPDEVAA